MVAKKAALTCLAVPGLAALALLSGCSATSAPSEENGEVELRTYTVPQGLETDARNMLRRALGPSEAPVGQVQKGPGGTLVVVAPKSVHVGVERLIGELQDVEPPSMQKIPVSLTYWLVVGRPSADLETDWRQAPGSRLDDVAPVLAEIARSEGPMEFQLLEQLQLTSTGDGRAVQHGSVAKVEQWVSVVQDSVVADLKISLKTDNLGVETQVKLQPGQALVLGQAGFRGAQSRDPLELEGMLFYVISSDLEQ